MTSQDVILGLLHKRPLTGYEIKSKFEIPFSFFFDASYGTIYPTLIKMESLGYITKESVLQENRPNKNVYSITEKGRERFKAYMNSPIEKETFRSDFLVRLYFGEFQDKAAIAAWLGQELERTQKELQCLAEGKLEWSATMSPSQMLCVNIGIEANEARAKVLKEGLAQMKQ